MPFFALLSLYNLNGNITADYVAVTLVGTRIYNWQLP
jgi:hypothetical protein